VEGPVAIQWGEVLRVRYHCDDDSTLAGLRPGGDLLLQMPRRWGAALPDGVLLDDLLSQEARQSLDTKATNSLAAWREVRGEQLTIDQICLPEIWEQELLAEVFLPETRIVSGLRDVLSSAQVRSVELEGFDDLRLECIRHVANEFGLEMAVVGPRTAAPTYPSILAAPWRIPLAIRTAKALLGTTGIPRNVRGSVYVLGYWHLVPVIERLAREPRYHPVLDPWHLPRTGVRPLIRMAVEGGWGGRPGRSARREARERVAVAAGAALAAADPYSDSDDPLARLLDVRALSMLQQRAGDYLALAASMRRTFASKRIRAAVLPYDSPPDARSIAQAARENGVPTLVVQHGFFNEPNDSDKTTSDVAAVWADEDVRQLAGRAQGKVVRTGNPGVRDAESLVRPTQQASLGNTLLLVEYSSRLSTRIDARISMRHVSEALRGLERARRGTAVTIRPHPAEHEPEIFERLAAAHPGLKIRVDSQTPIDGLISGSDLCVASISTAALEAAAAGIPVVVLNVTGRPARPPFDGSSGVPVATNSAELAELIDVALDSAEIAGRQAMLEALGLQPDAIERVIDLIQTMSEGCDRSA
jgi:hypothetical protein